MTMRTWSMATLGAVNVTTNGAASATPTSVNAPAADDWTITNTAILNQTGIHSLNAGNTVVYNGSASVDSLFAVNTAATSKMTLNGGAGVDNIAVSVDQLGLVTVRGGAGIDTLSISATALTGAAGTAAVTRVMYDGLDKIDGPAAAKFILDASETSAGVTWNLAAGTLLAAGVAAAAGSTAIVGNLTGVVGSTAADTITTTGATGVTVDGGSGADTLSATGAVATNVTFVYDSADKAVTGRALAAGVNDILDASANTSGISLFLNDAASAFTLIDTVTGGSGADNIRGTLGVASITGGKGNDMIWAGSHATATTVNGGAGDDQFWYGAGELAKTIQYTGTDGANDTINLYNISAYDVVGEGRLVAGAAAGNGTVVVGGVAANTLTIANSAVGVANTSATKHFVSQEGWAFDVQFGGAAGTSLTGTAGVVDNLVAAAAAGITMDGKGGNDNLYGNTGNDTFVFHKGDVIYSGGGADAITAVSSASGEQIYLDTSVSTSTTSPATSWNVTGSGYGDELRGQTGVTAQTLNGGAGDDFIWGGAGATNVDTLIGGAGVDTYYYGIDEANDTIAAGAIAATGNAGDVLNFYNVSDVSKLAGALVGNDMQITVTGTAGSTVLTLQGWNAGSINKLADVVVSGKAYTLGLDASGTTAVFTAK